MDHGHRDSEPTFTGGHRPRFSSQTTGRLVELSQDAVAVFYPSLQHVRLGPEPDPSSLPSVSDGQTGGPQNVDILPLIIFGA